MEMLRAQTAQTRCVNKAPPPTTRRADVNVVKTPGKSPRSRRQKAASKTPQHVHKQLMLEPSTAPVCNCSELLRRLQTTINEPPPFHFTDIESTITDVESTIHCEPRSFKKESLFVVQSTASFADAIVIDSDDSCDEALHSEPHPECTQSTFDIQQSQNDVFQHNEDSESPKKPIDIIAKSLDIAITVSLPLPKKLSTRRSAIAEQPQQRHNSETSHPSRRSLKWNERNRRKSADQEISASNGDTVRSSCVSDEVAETELGVSVETVPQCLTDSQEGEQGTSLTEASADGIAELVEHEQRSIQDVSDSVEPDAGPVTLSTYDESDCFRENAQRAQVTVDVEPLDTLMVKDQLPDQFDESVPQNTGALADRVEDDEDSQHSATSTKNVAVEKEECRVSEKTLTEIDIPAVNESHIPETAAAAAEVFECSLPSAVLNVPPTPQTTVAEVNLLAHTEISSTLSSASDEPDPSIVDLDHNKTPSSPCVRLRLRANNKSGKASSHLAAEAVKKKAAKVKKSTLHRHTYKRLVTMSTGKKFKKSARVRKRHTASSERLQPQTEETVLLSNAADGSSTNTMGDEKNLISTEEAEMAEKYPDTEHVMPSIEQDTAAAAESDPALQRHQKTPSPSPDVTSLTEIYDAFRRSPVVEDQHADSQVVTAHGAQLSVSPTHTDDDEFANLSGASIPPVSSPPDPDWIKTKSGNRERHTYSHSALSNRLQGISV